MQIHLLINKSIQIYMVYKLYLNILIFLIDYSNQCILSDLLVNLLHLKIIFSNEILSDENIYELFFP